IAPMIACTRAINPPIETPCITRAPIMTGIEWAKPAIEELAINRRIASWTSSFLLNRSANFRQIGVPTVIINKLAVITQVYSRRVPAHSAIIVGVAVDTIVADSNAVNRAAISPTMIGVTSFRGNACGTVEVILVIYLWLTFLVGF